MTSANEIALLSKNPTKKREIDGRKNSRKEGAAYIIREECERLFCETMKNVFLGERDSSRMAPAAMGANAYSPPDKSVNAYKFIDSIKCGSSQLSSWLEVWDYAGGCSFRGFVAGTGTTASLFVFFNSDVVGRELKQG